MKNKNLLLGILGGLAIGAVVGILFAPDKGTETRKKIAKKGKDLAKKGNDLKESLKDSASKFAGKISETVEGYKN